MCAEHYENPTVLSKVTAKNVGDVFFETHCRMRKEEFSGHNENCQQNASDLEGSLVTSSRPPGRPQIKYNTFVLDQLIHLYLQYIIAVYFFKEN